MGTIMAIEYAHPEDAGQVTGSGEPRTCYHANGARNLAAGTGHPRYSGPGCDREHIEIRTALTFPAAIQAQAFAGDHYAAHIQRAMVDGVASGRRFGDESLGELYVGNDGD